MTKPNPMYLEDPLGLAHARRMTGGTDRVKLALLIPAMPKDYGYMSDEFTGALSASKWTTDVTVGAGPTAFAYAAVRGGVIQGATGATDNDATAVHGTQTFMDPDDNPFMFIQWRSNIVTGFSFEVGLSEAKTDEALPGCTTVDVPTVANGASDLLAVHMDTDATLTTAALVGDGTTPAAAKQNLYRGGPGGSTGYTPTAAAWQTFLIGVRDNLGYCSIWDGDAFVGRFSVATGPDGGVLVRPYALFRTRNTTTKTIDIRKIVCGWEQNG